ncbi:MAG: UTRA domain-containing protein [Roseovarius pacificus]|nr:UTRA domain-containing protein [Roseovarius pacificus]
MTKHHVKGWQAIQHEVLRRIHAREWPPGHVIPNEVDLAQEFGCARATVNRALRALAEEGLLDRRRKAGTRVALHPVTRATVDISVIRQEIEERGQHYDYRLLTCDAASPPAPVRATLGAGPALHVTALHSGDGAPYVFEDRWISLKTTPDARQADFTGISANEWLLAHAPYTHGDIAFSAEAASAQDASLLNTAAGAPLFVVTRTTWDHDCAVTAVRLAYAPGYRIHTRIGAQSDSAG